ncbi:cytochrome c [Chelativorans sp. AA-79]|uniref:c-type cytochrome n=1 Tax=Chelativorans sp. AA-79 TaxID=3028735 RepID=UPI0023F7B387|nr:cytochrome c [Chelativorans sp. AA-79]WEX10909.1 cytochrome c [Chelativorans sp. AA-79]
MACHTDLENDGRPFAGGRGLETPFGTIYSSNLTPDEETGLGRWSREDFFNALNEGIDREERHLYPAMPYPYFTLMTREDTDAIYAYLRTLEPVRSELPENDLPFPLSIRQSVWGWKLLFFDDEEFVASPERSEEWNRGRYLVDGPLHCGGCHTGKNALGAADDDEYLRGGVLENWFAPNILGGENGGIVDWEHSDIVEFLGDGRARHTAPMQRMGEVVAIATQFLHEDDLEAIATYLKSLEDDPREEQDQPDVARVETGEGIYFDNYAACHAADRSGVPNFFAPLETSNKVLAEDPSTAIRIILGGARAQPTEAAPSVLAMPPFAWKLSDDQIADLLTYLRQSGDRNAGSVSASEIAEMREYLANEH